MEVMRLFQIILVLSSLIFLTNCVGVSPDRVDIKKIKKERKLPKPNFLIPDAQYVTSGNGSSWDLRQFMDFRFWSPPYFNSKEARQHKAAVYTTLENMKDFEVVSWYSKKRLASGKVRVIHSYPISGGYCRTYQAYIKLNGKERHMTNNACKYIGTASWSFYK